MKRVTSIWASGLVAAAVVGTIGHAVAFQEQGGRAPVDGAPHASVATTVTSPSAGVLPRTGTEIRLPGLGQIGSLPKFDFGLELLYGAGEPKGVREELNKTDQNDLQVRGTLKFKLPN